MHCGADCGNFPVFFDEKPFCCGGCVAVYQILNHISVEKSFDSRFAYLDNVEIQNQILDFSENHFSIISLYLPNIHCKTCVFLLENLSKLQDGILSSQVNFLKKEISVQFDNTKTSPRKIVELLTSLHYEPLISLEKKEKKSVQRNLLYKIGIAGFCFGNSMMLSLPEYLPNMSEVEFPFKTFFGILNFFLSLPVVIFCANEYWFAVFRNIQFRRLTSEVPIAVGIAAIFVESSVQIFSQTGTGYMDSLTGLIFFLLVGKWIQTRTYESLSFEKNFKSFFPLAVSKLENSEEISIPITQIQKNDRLLIKNFEIIPCDSRLISKVATIDYSFISGESLSVLRQEGEKLFAGGRQINGFIEVEVLETFENSSLIRFWNEQKTSKTHLSKLSDKIGKNFTIIIFLIAICSILFWFFRDKSLIINVFTSILIVSCPCAFLLAMPFAFGNTMRIFGKNGLFLRNSDVVEQLSQIDTIIFDKTGTLTQPFSKKISFSTELDDFQKNIIAALVKNSLHPLSQNIYQFLKNFDTKHLEVVDYQEVIGEGICAKAENILVKIGSENFVLGTKNFSSQTKVFVSFDNAVLGFFVIENIFRKNIENVISKLSQYVDLHILTGDNETDKHFLHSIFPNISQIHFYQTPRDKKIYVENLQKNGKKVLMLGDGINDSGALLSSDVGIVLVEAEYRFFPSCAGILRSDSFEKLPHFLISAKKSLKIVYFCFLISLIYNVIGISIAFQGFLSPFVAAILMPLSSVSVVLFATFLTSLKVNI